MRGFKRNKSAAGHAQMRSIWKVSNESEVSDVKLFYDFKV